MLNITPNNIILIFLRLNYLRQSAPVDSPSQPIRMAAILIARRFRPSGGGVLSSYSRMVHTRRATLANGAYTGEYDGHFAVSTFRILNVGALQIPPLTPQSLNR